MKSFIYALLSFLFALLLLNNNTRSDKTLAQSYERTIFENMVNDKLEKNLATTKKLIEDQQVLLDKISYELHNHKAKEIIVERIIETPKPVTKVIPAPIIRSSPVIRSSPARMPGPKWNVNGNWNYNLSEIANHLRTTHNIDPSGLTKEELAILHDNAHNGYKTSINCPDGTCPNVR